MSLDDISDEPHTERVRGFLRGIYGMDARTMTREALDHCEQLATAEMLNEIHFMLRTLTKGPQE